MPGKSRRRLVFHAFLMSVQPIGALAGGVGALGVFVINDEKIVSFCGLEQVEIRILSGFFISDQISIGPERISATAFEQQKQEQR